MAKWYILEGNNPVEEPDLRKWAQWFEIADRQVDLTEIPPGICVSTVFLGLGHLRYPTGKPMLFESMVFRQLEADDDEEPLETRRYATWEEAENGHVQLVAKYRQELGANRNA